MTTMMEICLEELDIPDNDEPYIRCVAMPGGQPGLELDRDGKVRWMPETPADYGLWTSADGRLVLMRSEGSAPVIVERRARTLNAPVGKPVILMDQDLLQLEGRRFRIHFHGETEQATPPERLSRSAIARFARAAVTAASLALGGVAVAAGADAMPSDTIEVRLHPPKPAPSRRPVYCRITRQKANKKGKGVKIHGVCSSTSRLHVGQWGDLITKKSSARIKDGQVKIKSITKNKVVVEAPRLAKPVKDAQIRFWVSRF